MNYGRMKIDISRSAVQRVSGRPGYPLEEKGTDWE